MIRKSLLALVLGSALAGVSAASYAQEAPKPEGDNPGLQQTQQAPEPGPGGENPEDRGGQS
jgi:hypothetical protein